MTNQACKIPNIVDEVYKQNWNQKYLVFSLCFSNFDGGYFSIGGYNRKLHKKNEKINIISYNQGCQKYRICQFLHLKII